MVEDANVMFLNFAGREGPYNREGDRNFTCALPPQDAEALLLDGWNVRELKPKEEGDEPIPVIEVSVGYKFRPPKIVVITSTSRTHYGEDIVATLDDADIRQFDFIARNYDWDVNGKQGRKAYLQTAYITIEEDALERKYALVEQGDNNDDRD